VAASQPFTQPAAMAAGGRTWSRSAVSSARLNETPTTGAASALLKIE
jgi:hypothetical protein